MKFFTLEALPAYLTLFPGLRVDREEHSKLLQIILYLFPFQFVRYIIYDETHLFKMQTYIILFKTFQQLLPTRLASNTMLFSFSKVLSLHQQPGFPQTFKIRLVSITMCPFPNTPHVTCLMCPPHQTHQRHKGSHLVPTDFPGLILC